MEKVQRQLQEQADRGFSTSKICGVCASPGGTLEGWTLLDVEAKCSYTKAIKVLHLRLDPGSRTLTAQEFRHTTQGDSEKVVDFVRRLERTLTVAYGREGMSTETRDTLLYCQLQDDLRHDLVQAPSVSGAQTYQELCSVAHNEEKRLAELKDSQQCLKPLTQQQQHQFEDRLRHNQSTNLLGLPHLVVPMLIACGESALSVMSQVT